MLNRKRMMLGVEFVKDVRVVVVVGGFLKIIKNWVWKIKHMNVVLNESNYFEITLNFLLKYFN